MSEAADVGVTGAVLARGKAAEVDSGARRVISNAPDTSSRRVPSGSRPSPATPLC